MDYHGKIFQLLEDHHNWFSESLPLIASENTPSPAVREAIISDLGNRYAEGWPGERVYAGCRYIDQVELLCIDLAKKLFRAEFADVRPISGVCANLVVYTAFTRPGDRMMALSIPSGGHISMGKRRLGGTAGAVHGLGVDYFEFDVEEMNIDVDKTKKKIEERARDKEHPMKLAMFGGSVFPFPHPVRELADAFHDIGATVCYDGAHVAGLIAGGKFQDPLREGADAMTISTHKTLPGPQGGAVLSWSRFEEQIKRATFPGNVSNHHLHHVAGKAVAFAEMLAFGEEYADQVIRNSKALGQALYERGFDVLGERRGFTESHVLNIDIVRYGDGATLEKMLEEANIILNRNLLPYDIKMGRHFQAPGGIRIGTLEVTRLGMRESEMVEIAELIKRVVVDGEPPSKVRGDVIELRKDFQEVHYCFKSARRAYEYIKIR
ncbi:MAG: serine hydroxymethyltransferase [Candidatus Geothermarchaeales archaeon]